MPLVLVLALGWLAGVWLAAQVALPAWAWLLPAALAGLALFLLRRNAALRQPLAFILLLGLGGARLQVSRPVYNAAFLATYNDQGAAAVGGVVCDEPDVRDTYVRLRLCAETLLRPGVALTLPVHGRVLFSAPRFSEERLQAAGDAEFQYGDRLSVSGWLVTPPEFESFSYRDYLERQEVYSQIQPAQITFIAAHQGNPVVATLFNFKARALYVLSQIFPEPHASLLSGILLGAESGIPQELKDAFSATGTSHIVAISGFNIAIIAGIFAVVANRLFGARYGSWIAILGIAAYAVLVGASASVLRAALMGSLALVAQRIGRRVLGLNTLAVAVFLMTLQNPLTLWDVGFQLSVGATLGLVLYAEPFEAGFKNFVARFTSSQRAERVAALAGEIFLLTLAAQVTTLPLMAYYFKSVSLISLVANMLILPAQPPLMLLAGLALCLGLIALPLGALAAWLAWPFSAYTIALVQLFAQAPGATFYLGEVAPWLITAVYAALFGLTWMLNRPPEQRPAWWKTFAANGLPTAGLSALAIGAVIAWSYYFSLPDPGGRLKISVLDVGPGDAILIETPAGAHVLIDGGPSAGALTRALARQLPLFTRELDLLVIAGTLDENLGGLPEALKRYRVKQVVVTGATEKEESAAYRTLMQMFAGQKIETASAADLPGYDLGEGIRLRVIFDGAHGAALRLEWRRFALLLPVGLRRADENTLLQHTGVAPATALLLGDHGSERATGADWVWAVNPRVALISVSAGNALRNPAPKILERLAGRAVLRTDLNGTLTLFTDGKQLWVETER